MSLPGLFDFEYTYRELSTSHPSVAERCWPFQPRLAPEVQTDFAGIATLTPAGA